MLTEAIFYLQFQTYLVRRNRCYTNPYLATTLSKTRATLTKV